MNLKYGSVLITLIYFTILIYKSQSVKSKTYYNPEISCNSTQKFDCRLVNSSYCIDVKYLCNGYEDCLTGTDESSDFCSNVTCSTDHFTCDKYKCISRDWLCDGEIGN